MPDGLISPEMTMFGAAPEHIGAVFTQGRNAGMWFITPDIPQFDVREKEKRDAMVLQNLGAFASNVASPELKWKAAVDFYVSDLKQAAMAAKLERAASLETEKDIKAMMAVMASARAMEKSGGSFEKYAMFITQSSPPDMDKADTWADYLIHGDREKLERVINSSLVKRYYDKLMVDAQQGRTSRLAEYLTSEKPKGASEDWRHKGVEEYISDQLLSGDPADFIEGLGAKGIDDLGRFAAARLATDAFLIDKYTQWEFANDPAGELRLKPTFNWGGDTLRTVIEPSFLPRRVKGMYKDAPGILDAVDTAFRLDDIANINETFRKSRLQPTMTMKLKDLGRYSDALKAFLGGTRAEGLPLWTKDTLGKDLPAIVEKMDQVYGGMEEEKDDGTKFPIGKHLMGLIIARVIAIKATAAVIESAKPNLADRLAYLTEAKGGEYFEEARAFLWGPKFDATEGFLYQCYASRTGIVFARNMFPGVRELLAGAKDMLEFNVGKNEVGKETFYKRLKGILIILQGLGAEKIRR